jgi:hypothetical protein
LFGFPRFFDLRLRVVRRRTEHKRRWSKAAAVIR